MYEIVKEDQMRNINQNKGNNGNRISDNEVLETTKLSNQISVLVTNRSKMQIRESEAFL
jgi:hypothetical protein